MSGWRSEGEVTPEQKLESIRRLIAAREDVYDDWVGIDDLKSIIDNGVEPEHVAEQLKPWYFTEEQRRRIAEQK